MESVIKCHDSKINGLTIYDKSILTVGSDQYCKQTDIETEQVVSEIGYTSVPLKIEFYPDNQFIMTTDNFGNIFLNDFRAKVGRIQMIDNSTSPVSCIIKNEYDFVFFDYEKNSRIVDFRNNEIIVIKRLKEVVNCGVSSKNSKYIITADKNINLYNKYNLELKMVHPIQKGQIHAMTRVGNSLFTGGFDCEIKVILLAIFGCAKWIISWFIKSISLFEFYFS